MWSTDIVQGTHVSDRLARLVGGTRPPGPRAVHCPLQPSLFPHNGLHVRGQSSWPSGSAKEPVVFVTGVCVKEKVVHIEFGVLRFQVSAGVRL